MEVKGKAEIKGGERRLPKNKGRDGVSGNIKGERERERQRERELWEKKKDVERRRVGRGEVYG